MSKDIKGWLIDRIANESSIHPTEVDCEKNFEDFHLDSLAAVSMAFDIEKEFGIEELSPTAFTEFSSINRLSEWIQQQQ